MTVSDQYRIIETSAILATIREELESIGFGAEGGAYLYKTKGKGTTHLVRWNLPVPMEIHGDKVTPSIHLFNSYGGECALAFFAGFIRWACSNGMVVGESLYSTRIIHRKGPTADEKLAGIAAGVRTTVEYLYGSLASDIEELTAADREVEHLVQIAGSLPQLSNRVKGRVIEKLLISDWRRAADQSNNLWTLWNLANEMMAESARSRVANTKKNLNLLDDILFLDQNTAAAGVAA